jgi:hypothetical protein
VRRGRARRSGASSPGRLAGTERWILWCGIGLRGLGYCVRTPARRLAQAMPAHIMHAGARVDNGVPGDISSPIGNEFIKNSFSGPSLPRPVALPRGRKRV